MAGTIAFFNNTQKALWDNEILGQISDGMWENSPNSNWEFWHYLTSTVSGQPGVKGATTYGNVNLNLANPQLIEVVGDRMIAMAKMAKLTKDNEVIRAAKYLEGITSEEDLHKMMSKPNYKGSYMEKELSKIPDELFQKWLLVPYTKTNLVADLKAMSDIMKTAKHGVNSYYSRGVVSAGSKNQSKGAERILGGYDSKDEKRIRDLMNSSRSGAEMLSKARTMALKITDGAKALRRARAAESENLHDVAEVFFDRAKNLGFTESQIREERAKYLIESKMMLKEEENTSKTAFDLLDEARKAVQDAQANLYIQMPAQYQQLYKNELASVYNHCHNAIAEIQQLAKKMHEQLGV